MLLSAQDGMIERTQDGGLVEEEAETGGGPAVVLINFLLHYANSFCHFTEFRVGIWTVQNSLCSVILRFFCHCR